VSEDQPDLPPDEQDDLVLSEASLLRLGADIPDPTKAESPKVLYPALIGTRARSLYQNFLHSLDGPTAIGPLLAIRPLVEAAILLKWISLNPELHGELWFAQSDDRELTAIREQQKHLGLFAEGSSESLVLQAIEEKAAARDDSVAKGKAAGKRYGDRPLPDLARMVGEIEQAEPGHKTVMRQSYDVIYRTFSAWQHTEAASFKATASDDSVFLGDISPYKVEHLRVMAAAQFAYVLEILGVALGDGSDVGPRMIRHFLIVVRPTSRKSDESQVKEGQ
jgi:hypothetical protein